MYTFVVFKFKYVVLKHQCILCVHCVLLADFDAYQREKTNELPYTKDKRTIPGTYVYSQRFVLTCEVRLIALAGVK